MPRMTFRVRLFFEKSYRPGKINLLRVVAMRCLALITLDTRNPTTTTELGIPSTDSPQTAQLET